MDLRENYLAKLKTRQKTSHIYENYQLDGLEVAKLLNDDKHKSLYIKLAKEHGGEKLRRIARDVADRDEVMNKGAYFMRLITGKNDNARPNIHYKK